MKLKLTPGQRKIAPRGSEQSWLLQGPVVGLPLRYHRRNHLLHWQSPYLPPLRVAGRLSKDTMVKPKVKLKLKLRILVSFQ